MIIQNLRNVKAETGGAQSEDCHTVTGTGSGEGAGGDWDSSTGGHLLHELGECCHHIHLQLESL